MENKQTAVEFLEQQLYKAGWEQLTHEEKMNICCTAKLMEKEQHSKTWDTALDKYEVRAGNYIRAYEDFDEYYNETYSSGRTESVKSE